MTGVRQSPQGLNKPLQTKIQQAGFLKCTDYINQNTHSMKQSLSRLPASLLWTPC